MGRAVREESGQEEGILFLAAALHYQEEGLLPEASYRRPTGRRSSSLDSVDLERCAPGDEQLSVRRICRASAGAALVAGGARRRAWWAGPREPGRRAVRHAGRRVQLRGRGQRRSRELPRTLESHTQPQIIPSGSPAPGGRYHGTRTWWHTASCDDMGYGLMSLMPAQVLHRTPASHHDCYKGDFNARVGVQYALVQQQCKRAHGDRPGASTKQPPSF